MGADELFEILADALIASGTKNTDDQVADIMTAMKDQLETGSIDAALLDYQSST